jgi:hypothetical protein
MNTASTQANERALSIVFKDTLFWQWWFLFAFWVLYSGFLFVKYYVNDVEPKMVKEVLGTLVNFSWFLPLFSLHSFALYRVYSKAVKCVEAYFFVGMAFFGGALFGNVILTIATVQKHTFVADICFIFIFFFLCISCFFWLRAYNSYQRRKTLANETALSY